jgi:hypothetical protein
MNNKIPPTLLQLWKFAGNDSSASNSDWNLTFDPIGLILLTPPRNYGYWCTPTNSLTFATTGGDGVHYGLLATNGEFTDFSPVVMTVPMCDAPNTIVGANLREFLALGCRFGYFALEQLIYRRKETLLDLKNARFGPEIGIRERGLLVQLASAFEVLPWTNPEQRLSELDVLFTSTLQLSPIEKHE